MARHLGTEHSELFVSSSETQAVIHQLPSMYDEPFADSSQIPTHLVCAAARQQVTVALSGDAGDELFGGYDRYRWGPRIWNRLEWLPLPARRGLGAAIAAIPGGAWDALGNIVNRSRPKAQGVAHAGDKAHKLAARLTGVRSMDDLYFNLVSEWQDPAEVVRGDLAGSAALPAALSAPLPAAGVDDASARMMYRDSVSYLPDDILCKVDRAAMAISLETRVPLLDHRVAELAWRLPMDMKIRDGQGKWALRQVLYRHVPRELIERPKAGFGIPDRGSGFAARCKPWAESIAGREASLACRGLFPPGAHPPAKWAEHVSGPSPTTRPSLWAVLMFQAWLELQERPC